MKAIISGRQKNRVQKGDLGCGKKIGELDSDGSDVEGDSSDGSDTDESLDLLEYYPVFPLECAIAGIPRYNQR